MKRSLYLIIYLSLLLVGCNVHEWPDKREMVSFYLNLNFHPAMGEQDYFYSRGNSRSAVDAHDLRYVVRAYPLNADGSASSEHTAEFVFSKPNTAIGDDYNYSTRLELPAGSYRLSVWADFVDAGTTSHTYYNYDNFSSIVLHGSHKANTDYRDAFSGSQHITLESSIYEDVELLNATVEMTRPLAKYTFISTDLKEFIDKELLRMSRNEASTGDELQSDAGSRVIDLEDYKVMIYYPMYMPNTYNIFTDKAVNSATGVMYESKLTRLDVNEASMGFDYVVINDDPDAKVTVKVGLFDLEGNQLAMSESFNIPLKRSVNTLVRGKFLVVDADGGISIDPSFDGDHNIVLP